MNRSAEAQIWIRKGMGESLRQARELAGLSREKIVDLLDARGVSSSYASLSRLEQQDKHNLELCLGLLSLYRELGAIGPEFLEQIIYTPGIKGTSVERRDRLIRKIINHLPQCDLAVIECVAQQIVSDEPQVL